MGNGLTLKKKTEAVVIGQTKLAEGIFDLRLETELAREAACGQFVLLYPRRESALLGRPISICEWDGREGWLRLVYRVAGLGTQEFSRLRTGDRVPVLGMLGNGFPVGTDRRLREDTDDSGPGAGEGGAARRILLIGGGIGIPPLLGLVRALAGFGPFASVTALLGYRDGALFLKDDFAPYARVLVATEDGSFGERGNVMDLVRRRSLEADRIYACGPLPMLRAVKSYAQEKKIPAWISLEERMACGVGACLGCVCGTKEVDAHSHVRNARVCTEGPVFEAGDVEI